MYVGVVGRNRAKALAHAQHYAQTLQESAAAEVLGPAPYPIARLNDEWRFRLALKGRHSEPLRTALRELILPAARAHRESRIVINVDP